MFSEDLLKDEVILVTGGGSGLGLAMSRRFIELGAQVALCGRSQGRLDGAVESLSGLGKPVSAYSVDVREFKDVGKMFESIIEQHGTISGLVNNAAGNFYALSETLAPKGFKSVVDIVLHGTFNCTQHFGKHLIKQSKPGSVLNIVTTYTQSGSAFVLPSACAKAGVLAMTKSLAWEWAPHKIRLNAIAPGPFPTEGAWSRLVPKEFEKQYRSLHPMKRFGKPEELADLAAFLMSPLSAYINGECVTIDGGMSLDSPGFNFISHAIPQEQLKTVFDSLRKGAKK